MATSVISSTLLFDVPEGYGVSSVFPPTCVQEAGPPLTIHADFVQDALTEIAVNEQPETFGDREASDETDLNPGVILQSWSSPLPDHATVKASSKFTASGKYLEFLSIFLTEPRQVDVAFHVRHALVTFLMESLEMSFWNYAHRTIPNELEALQIFAADELELPLWRILMLRTLGSNSATSHEDIDLIRHVAVHRYRYDTTLVRAAAMQATYLSDDILLEQMDLIVRVLYADTNASSRYPVTEEQRKLANGYLWPTNRPIETFHGLLDRVQTLGEKSSYQFCQQHMPQTLIDRGITAAEQLELPEWQFMIQNYDHSQSAQSPESRQLLANVLEQLERIWTRQLRNATAHRQIFFLDENNKLQGLIKQVVNYVRVLGDEKTAAEIEDLTAKTTELLLRKHEEWMHPAQWRKSTRGHKSIDLTISRRMAEWQERKRSFTEIMDVSPIVWLYIRSSDRMYVFKEKERLVEQALVINECRQQDPVSSPTESDSPQDHQVVAEFSLSVEKSGSGDDDNEWITTDEEEDNLESTVNDQCWSSEEEGEEEEQEFFETAEEYYDWSSDPSSPNGEPGDGSHHGADNENCLRVEYNRQDHETMTLTWLLQEDESSISTTPTAKDLQIEW